MIVIGIVLLLFASMPTVTSTFESLENMDLSENVDFARDFVERLNEIYNDTKLEITEPTEKYINPYNTPAKTNVEFLHDFARDIAISGAKHLKNVALTIRKIMKAQSENNSSHSNKNSRKESFNSSNNDYPKEILMAYTTAIKYKYNYTVENYIKHFEEQSILLNFVEEANEELFTKKTLLLKHYLVYSNGKMSPKWSRINEIINFDYMEQKHLYLQELCYKREICKPYPGFTDHMANLIEDVISLPAGTFHKLIMMVKKLLVEKTDFFESVIHEKDLATFSVMMDYMKKGDYFAAKDVLRQVRNFNKDKFKLVKSTDPVLKGRTKAIRMLMEIVDKVFEKDGLELMKITFGSLRSALKAAARENISDIKKILADFVKHSLNLCSSQWGEQSREEVKTLVEAALKGSSVINPELLKDLFEFGSEFLHRDPVDLYML